MNRPIVLAAFAASLLVARAALAAPSCPPPDPKKTTICHVPPGNPVKKQTLVIGNSAVRAHLANHPGDSAGACAAVVCGNGLCEVGETPATCFQDCGCNCSAAVNVSGLAIDLGTILGVGTGSLNAGVCTTCSADASSIAFTFTPSIEAGGTSFTFNATAVGAPTCNLVDDVDGPLGNVIVSGQGTIVSNGQQQPTSFTLTLVEVAGQICTAILVVDPATILGVPTLTVPLSIPCGDLTLQTCETP